MGGGRRRRAEEGGEEEEELFEEPSPVRGASSGRSQRGSPGRKRGAIAVSSSGKREASDDEGGEEGEAEDDDDDEYPAPSFGGSQMSDTQREAFRKTFHMLVSDVASAAAGHGLSKAFLHVLATMVFEKQRRVASDVELFMRHGKRKTVSAEDVLLYARNNDGLRAELASVLERFRAARPARKRRKRQS